MTQSTQEEQEQQESETEQQQELNTNQESEEQQQQPSHSLRLPRNSTLLTARDSHNTNNKQKQKTSKARTTSSPEKPKQQQRKPKRVKRRENQEDEILARFQGSFHAVLTRLLRLITWPLKYILTILLPHTFAGLTATAILLSVLYLLLMTIQRFFSSRLILPSLSLLANPVALVGRSLSLVTPSLLSFYCSTLHAPFFCTDPKEDHQREQKIAQYARTVSDSAQKAADIFDSVLLLSNPNLLRLHQADILELAYALRWASALDNKDALAHQLAQLAELTRSLKDSLIDLNGQSLNAFSFIAYEFSRLGDLMEWVEKGEKKYTSETIGRNLSILFEHLTSEMDGLLGSIEGLIPVASRSTNLGLRVMEGLHRAQYELIGRREAQGVLRKLTDLSSFSGRQLRRDLALTSESIAALKRTWTSLEQLRADLLAFRNHVAHFRASFVGAHLADHQLEPLDELFSMRQIIQGFQNTLALLKSNSRHPNHPSSSEPNRLLPSESNHQHS
ncbi:uncharacterized protein PGTG_09956 [Puccinia graminis f. sp. tritici CRL 75-36-700-3]|uniref:Uncharacterized protein n=1 Tax=Puccinia graminis f. sp. tritici (strain CRL 75-36-700-3 / race SCCL) TaxID=418459 RepID=E3KFG1_PUCGT|nr:uncharacterized protein PGTG_09956 [Puccinia graminis f. sp. tritici CRL 75-36-700-3]EFP82988.1 hypothetical protein PGTG_09956 [Puccinia graminis f. sp. tritici CRL 75-36-700-3]